MPKKDYHITPSEFVKEVVENHIYIQGKVCVINYRVFIAEGISSTVKLGEINSNDLYINLAYGYACYSDTERGSLLGVCPVHIANNEVCFSGGAKVPAMDIILRFVIML